MSGLFVRCIDYALNLLPPFADPWVICVKDAGTIKRFFILRKHLGNRRGIDGLVFSYLANTG